MIRKWYFIIILINTNIIHAQEVAHVEVFFEIISSMDELFIASAVAPTYVPPDNTLPNEPPAILGNSIISEEIDPNNPNSNGFNLLLAGYDGDGDYPIMRYGI